MKKYSFFLITFLFSLCLLAQEKEVNLKIIQTSDIHGNFFPYNLITHQNQGGGLSRVSSLVKQERKIYGDNLLVVENGDILQGQPPVYYSNYIDTLSSHLCAEILNFIGYDLGNMGNHDIEAGRSVYERWINDCYFPILGANIIDTLTNQPYLPPYHIFERDGVKVAILGMITPAIPAWLPENLWSGLRFEDMEETARKWMPILRNEEKADVIIGLFHAGQNAIKMSELYNENASLNVAVNVPGFDAVLMGHDHLPDVRKIVNNVGDSVLIVNPANDGNTVGEVQIKAIISGNKVLDKKIIGTLIDTNGYPIDESYLKRFAPQYGKTNDFVSKKIGHFTNSISTRSAFFGSSAFIDLIHQLQLNISNAEISLAAPLSFDAQINEGDIYVSDMFNLYKYENMLYVMQLTGREIKGVLEESYYNWTNQMKSSKDDLLWFNEDAKGNNRYKLKNMSFNFDSAAGIIYTVDVTKPKGEKVTIVSMADGTPFQLDKMYRVALNSYRGNGGGELLTKGAGILQSELKNRIIFSTDKDLRFYLMKYIEEHPNINPQPMGQWKFIPENWVEDAVERDYKKLFGNMKSK